jgi:hypothetical protein
MEFIGCEVVFDHLSDDLWVLFEDFEYLICALMEKGGLLHAVLVTFRVLILYLLLRLLKSIILLPFTLYDAFMDFLDNFDYLAEYEQNLAKEKRAKKIADARLAKIKEYQAQIANSPSPKENSAAAKT